MTPVFGMPIASYIIEGSLRQWPKRRAALKQAAEPMMGKEGAVMTSWRERLCGTVALRGVNDSAQPSISLVAEPTTTLSCGGNHFTPETNKANMTTLKNHFVLPTDYYSVLVFNKEGNAVIYSDNRSCGPEEIEVVEAPADLEGSKIYH